MSKPLKYRTHKAHVKRESIADAARQAGVPYMTFYMRLKHGKTVSQAVKTPVRKYRKGERKDHSGWNFPMVDIYNP